MLHVFAIQFIGLCGAIGAVGFLMGSYMKLYAKSSETELGLFFCIPPVSMFAAPIVGAVADRHQNHRQLYLFFLVLAAVAHLPFAILPFIINLLPEFSEQFLTPKLLYWTLFVLHALGFVSLSCNRLLANVLAMNYARRVGGDFSNYRTCGAISIGVFSILLAYFNCNWILPDYVFGLAVWVASHIVVALLVHAWPKEFFVVLSEAERQELIEQGKLPELPTLGESWKHVAAKLLPCYSCCSSSATALKEEEKTLESLSGTSKTKKYLSVRQQTSIFLVLMKRDFRIPLYLLALLLLGFTGHSMHQFVYVYLDKYCNESNTCDASLISGYMLVGICVFEVVLYLTNNFFLRHLHHIVLISAIPLSLVAHYFSLGFLVRYSPWFFLAESLHGLEYGASVVLSVYLGHSFANEAGLIIPELIKRNIISENDDLNLVRVSLLATMMSSITLAYDGLGGMTGSYAFGWIISLIGYEPSFQLNLYLAATFLTLILTTFWIGKCLNIEPKLLKRAKTAEKTHPKDQYKTKLAP